MDFKELPVDGQALEQLVRELLYSRGLHVQWSGNGPDGGRDLICHETLTGLFGPQTKVWLVQCKHKAHGGGSVGVSDLDEIVETCHQHGATGYLLVCTTQPSSAVVARLEGVTKTSLNAIDATYWDAITLQRMLSTSVQWAIAQRFMPESCGDWKLYATDAPNDFVAHYKGYVFHLTNRIGSGAEHHLSSIRDRITELEAIDLPDNHFIRPRSVWSNDKSAEYVWYIDYMYPHNEAPSLTKTYISRVLGDGWALDDGHMYVWDIRYVKYMPMSDHYDKDHYDYYAKYMPNFLTGISRGEFNWDEYYASKQEIEKLELEAQESKSMAFSRLVKTLESLDFMTVSRFVNASPDCIGKLERKFDWADVFRSLNATPEHLFSAIVIIMVADDEKFHSMIKSLPQGDDGFFRLSCVHVYTPEGKAESSDEFIYDLNITVNRDRLCNEFEARKAFDDYFNLMTAAVKNFISSN